MEKRQKRHVPRHRKRERWPGQHQVIAGAELAKRVQQHRQVLLPRKAACIDEKPRARGQSKLASQRRRTALRRKRVDVDAERPCDDSVDSPCGQPCAHERARREHHIATPVELTAIQTAGRAGTGTEPPGDHLHDVAVAKGDQRHVERARRVQRRPRLGSDIADLDQVGPLRPNLPRPAASRERPAMSVRRKRPGAQVAFPAGTVAVHRARHEKRMAHRRPASQPRALRAQITHHAAARRCVQHGDVDQMHPSNRGGGSSCVAHELTGEASGIYPSSGNRRRDGQRASRPVKAHYLSRASICQPSPETTGFCPSSAAASCRTRRGSRSPTTVATCSMTYRKTGTRASMAKCSVTSTWTTMTKATASPPVASSPTKCSIHAGNPRNRGPDRCTAAQPKSFSWSSPEGQGKREPLYI